MLLQHLNLTLILRIFELRFLLILARRLWRNIDLIKLTNDCPASFDLPMGILHGRKLTRKYLLACLSWNLLLSLHLSHVEFLSCLLEAHFCVLNPQYNFIELLVKLLLPFCLLLLLPRLTNKVSVDLIELLLVQWQLLELILRLLLPLASCLQIPLQTLHLYG